MLTVTLLVVSLSMTAVVPAAAAGSDEPRDRQLEATLFDMHNQVRGESGLPELRWAQDLADYARSWSAHQGDVRRMYHTPDYASVICCFSWVAENIVSTPFHSRTVERTADRLMGSWMESPGHRANILDLRGRGHDQVGIGVAESDRGIVYVTAVFRNTTADGPDGTDGPDIPPVAEPGGDDGRPSDTTPPPGRVMEDGACPAGQAPTTGFRDVSDRISPSVGCLAWWRIAAGVSDDRYDPSAAVTRGQMASFMARSIVNTGGTLPDAVTLPRDVPAGSAHGPAICQLLADGALSGYSDGTFRAERPVTRGAMARFLAQSWQARTGRPLPESPTGRFPDAVDSSVFADDIARVAAAGLAAGFDDGTYRPHEPATRSQMALFIHRWLDTVAYSGQLPGGPDVMFADTAGLDQR